MHTVKDSQTSAIIGMTDEEFQAHKPHCPCYAENPPFNAVSMAAKAECDAIMRGDIPSKSFHSLEELLEDLRS